MERFDAIEKARKLLRLATSSNVNEAALAAAHAQKIMDRHGIETAMLALDGSGEGRPADPEEPIVDTRRAGSDASLDRTSRVGRWYWQLASSVSRANGARAYVDHNGIQLVGRPSDLETCRYLYAFLVREIGRLADRDCRGLGRVYSNNYRIGAVRAVDDMLKLHRRALADEIRAEASSSTALVKINRALVLLDQRGAAVETWMRQNGFRFGQGRGYSTQVNQSARQVGYAAAKNGISLDGARGRSLVGGGRRMLGDGR